MSKKAHILSLISVCAFLMSSCGETPQDPEPEEPIIRHVEAKSPTFYEDGNIEYYYDTAKNKYYDSNKQEISADQIKSRLDIIDFLDRKDPIKSFGKKLKIIYKAEEVNDIISKGNALISKIEGGSYYSAVDANDIITEINRLLSFTQRQYDIAYVLADASGLTADYELKTEIYNAYYNLSDEYYAVYVAMAKEGRYNDKFFPGWSQERINQYIAEHDHKGGGGGSPEKTTEQKIENLLNQYKAGKIERYTAFNDYVELAKQLASEKSYSSYLDYSYKQYGREYTVSQAKTLSNYTTNYILPLAQSFRSKLEEAEKNPDVVESNKAYKNNFFGSNIDLMRGYALTLDSSYINNFKSFFESGNYFFSNVANPNVTAYTANSQTLGRYIFASKNYQDLMSFTHEFGHYYAGTNFGNVPSLDLSETQSQGNELMLLSYLLGNNNSDSSKAFVYQEIASMANSILIGCAINEFEDFAYNNEFTQESLEAKFIEILDKYGALVTRDKIDYMYQVILNYRGYYISYAVSGIAALELFAKSLNNYADGVTSYVSICKKESSDEKFKKSLENAGLFDVFSDDSFTLINTIKNI